MTRNLLPERRASENFNFHLNGIQFVATLGFYDDGRLGEIFLNGGKIGSQSDVVVRDSAIMASIALQHGAPLPVLKKALTRDAVGATEGPLGRLFDLIDDGRLEVVK